MKTFTDSLRLFLTPLTIRVRVKPLLFALSQSLSGRAVVRDLHSVPQLVLSQVPTLRYLSNIAPVLQFLQYGSVADTILASERYRSVVHHRPQYNHIDHRCHIAGWDTPCKH